nr:MAG TPA: hypothetical protein [Caudoviricetes sp.]
MCVRTWLKLSKLEQLKILSKNRSKLAKINKNHIRNYLEDRILTYDRLINSLEKFNVEYSVELGIKEELLMILSKIEGGKFDV